MLHATKWPPPGGRPVGGFRPPLWLLSSAFSYLYDTGRETDSPVSPQVGCGTKCFCPQSLSLNSRVQQLLCPFMLLFLSRNKLNTLNPFIFLYILFFLKFLAVIWLAKETPPLPIDQQKATQDEDWRFNFWGNFFFLNSFLFFFFKCQGNEMKNNKCNGPPAWNSHPVASYISKAATSVPLSDH